MEVLNGALIKDLSGNGKDGTVTGATDTAVGAWGHARAFVAGSSQKIVGSPVVNGLTSWSLSFWVSWDGNTTNASEWVCAMGSDTTGSAGAYITTSNGNISVKGFTSGGAVATDTNFGTVAAGSFAHVAITYNGTTLLAYLNGALAQTISVSTIAIGTANLVAGANALSTAGTFFGGTIDEVYVFSRVLSAAEVTAIAKATQTRLTSPDGTVKIPLLEARVTMDINRDVAVAPITNNQVTDIDIKMAKRQFAITGSSTKYGAFAAQDSLNALEFLVMNYQDITAMLRVTLHWGNAATTSIVNAGTTYGGAGFWKTYACQIIKFTPYHDVVDTGGAARLFPWTLALVEGDTMANF